MVFCNAISCIFTEGEDCTISSCIKMTNAASKVYELLIIFLYLFDMKIKKKKLKIIWSDKNLSKGDCLHLIEVCQWSYWCSRGIVTKNKHLVCLGKFANERNVELSIHIFWLGSYILIV